MAMRHLHPQEVALLCGLFPSYVSPTATSSLKLDLAGVGQLASPIQALWISANLVHDLGKQGFLPPQPTPMQRLGTLLKTLLKDRNLWWDCQQPTSSMQLFEQSIETTFGDELDCDVSEGSFTQELHTWIHQPDQSSSAAKVDEDGTDSSTLSVKMHCLSEQLKPDSSAKGLPSTSQTEPSPASVGNHHVNASESIRALGSASGLSFCTEDPTMQLKMQFPSHVDFHAKPLHPVEAGPTSTPAAEPWETDATEPRTNAEDMPQRIRLQPPSLRKLGTVSSHPMLPKPANAFDAEEKRADSLIRPVSPLPISVDSLPYATQIHTHEASRLDSSHHDTHKPSAIITTGELSGAIKADNIDNKPHNEDDQIIPAHVPFHAMPHLPEGVGPTLTCSTTNIQQYKEKTS